jgi:S1-C subfamily serine protease
LLSSVQYARPVAIDSGVQRYRHPDGYTTVQSKIALANGYELRLLAAPERDAENLLFEISALDPDGAHLVACDLKLMVDLKRRWMRSTTHAQVRDRHALRVKLPAVTLVDVVVADAAALRTCEQVHAVDKGAQTKVAAFLMAFVEERRWAEEPVPDDGRPGALPNEEAAPVHKTRWTGNVVTRPQPSKGAKLSSEVLYKRLAPAVSTLRAFRFVGDGFQEIGFGSAVAINDTFLLTNWHVVEQGDVFAIEDGERLYEVRLVEGDPATDRAIVMVDPKEAKLVAVPGVRDFASLRVGEPVFAIGSPTGLDDTLSGGLISALRANQIIRRGGAANCVQTSAAISHGSSGGGLFDERGNLVGITTLFVGDAQNLNFAISADEFFKDTAGR